jgi:uncharacterized protein DUF4150/HNH/endonuclease VII toxin of polymorphic toxin system
MGCEVYANGMTIACKVADGKTVAAMPDVCLSPPTPPAGPVPLPYPNTAMASDTTKGSKTVQIGGKEVMLKNKSTLKKSTGDEAATKSLGMGVVSHQIQGEVNFCAWSMDVKFEGENVPRHLDLTLHNEMCNPANTPPWPYADRMAMAMVKGCDGQREKVKNACDPWDEKTACPDSSAVDAAKAEQRTAWASSSAGSPARARAQELLDIALEQYANSVKENPCHNELRCILVAYDLGCCPPQTPDHLIPASQFGPGRGRGHPTYRAGRAPCACAEGGKSAGTHGLLGRGRKKYMDDHGIPVSSAPVWSMEQSAKCGAASAKEVFGHCDEACFEAQIKEAHNRLGVANTDRVNSKQDEVRADLSGFAAEFIGGPPSP